jgi:hypothetical protein
MGRSPIIRLLLLVTCAILISHNLFCGFESPQACSSLHCLYASSLSGEGTALDSDLEAENSVHPADVLLSLPAAVRDIFHPPE